MVDLVGGKLLEEFVTDAEKEEVLELMIKEKLDEIKYDKMIVEGGLKQALETFPNNEVFKKYKLEFERLFKNKDKMTDELMVVAEEEEFLLSENQELEKNDDEGLEMTTVTTMMDADFSQNPYEQEIEVMKESHELGEEEKDKE
ncbi:hypothetical protein L6452_31167 [Arctium lappa]|uniref:Uncharacterized protein n=1 Tax=Arctium lappa TaxID=4217 RepID=A0ACB8ZJP9_ARCLA|nr:hypothetical protein L6452_31167 [Arctium lappa]